MKATANWNSGNFSLTHTTGELTLEAQQALCDKGLLWFMQRNREHDEVLGAFTKVDGKNVRKKGWKRGLVGFAEALAEKLKATSVYSCVTLELPDDVKIPVLVVTEIEEYLRDVADSKFTEEREILAKRESLPGDGWDKWLAKIGFDGETHGDDGEYSVDLLRLVRTKKLEAARAAAAAL